MTSEDDTDRRWHEAGRRVRDQLENGPRVRLISNQMSVLVVVVLFGGVECVAQLTESFTPRSLAQYVTFAAAIAFAVYGYRRARRTRRLMPQVPTPRNEWPLAPLLPEERRALGRQMRGKRPISERAVPVVRDLIHSGELNNRAVYPSLVGFFLFLLSITLFLGWPWPLLVVGLTVFLFVMTRIEKRRWARAFAQMSDTPQTQA